MEADSDDGEAHSQGPHGLGLDMDITAAPDMGEKFATHFSLSGLTDNRQNTTQTVQINVNAEGDDPNVIRVPRDLAVGMLNETASMASHVTANAVIQHAQAEFSMLEQNAMANHSRIINDVKAEAERRHAETLELINQQNVTWRRQMADEANARVEAEAQRSSLES